MTWVTLAWGREKCRAPRSVRYLKRRRDRYMARRSSLTNILFKAARASATARAARKGPVSFAKREARKAVYREEGKLTRRFFRGFGL